MARTFRIHATSPGEALAIAEVINSEGHWATYLPSEDGPSVLATCPYGTMEASVRMFGHEPQLSR
jgi:hypothetical protein